jgi:hypothetical protein
MKKLNESALAVGDVILTTSKELVSKGIRFFTGSDISHAMLYVQSHSVIDATGDGVHSRNTQRLHYPDDCPIYALRLKAPLPMDKLQKVIDFARSHVGTEYSSRQAAKTAFGGGNTWTRKQFCSRLVAQAFAKAGVLLVPAPNYCSPQDIKESNLLVQVPNVSVDISDTEKAAIDNIPNTQQMMIEATNILLEGARKINPGIQCLSDLDRFLIHSPEHDGDFAALYVSSGYLNLWKIEREKNECQYDSGLFCAAPFPEEIKKWYCDQLLQGRDEIEMRYRNNYVVYDGYLQQFPYKTFQLLRELYKTLLDLHLQRKAVAKEWLSKIT